MVALVLAPFSWTRAAFRVGGLPALAVAHAHLRAAEERGDGWRVPPPPEAPGVTEDPESLAASLTPQPICTFQQPGRLTNPAANNLSRAYVHCATGSLVPSFAPFAARFREARAGATTSWRSGTARCSPRPNGFPTRSRARVTRSSPNPRI